MEKTALESVDAVVKTTLIEQKNTRLKGLSPENPGCLQAKAWALFMSYLLLVWKPYDDE